MKKKRIIFKYFRFEILIIMVLLFIMSEILESKEILINVLTLSTLLILFAFSYSRDFQEDSTSELYSIVFIILIAFVFVIIVLKILTSSFDLMLYIPAGMILYARIVYIYPQK